MLRSLKQILPAHMFGSEKITYWILILMSPCHNAWHKILRVWTQSAICEIYVKPVRNVWNPLPLQISRMNKVLGSRSLWSYQWSSIWNSHTVVPLCRRVLSPYPPALSPKVFGFDFELWLRCHQYGWMRGGA